ncbi:hypothetical protein N7535_000872 [Penicillium sp. DV-2018c]|nr:hypothetical protein N7461_005883 [Penicillium sp. DV-2018c]KAJ5582252.1 hypothetical protein N7535_000872 [Penicillium sp. DV-2018c]
MAHSEILRLGNIVSLPEQTPPPGQNGHIVHSLSQCSHLGTHCLVVGMDRLELCGLFLVFGTNCCQLCLDVGKRLCHGLHRVGRHAMSGSCGCVCAWGWVVGLRRRSLFARRQGWGKAPLGRKGASEKVIKVEQGR